MVKFSIIVLTYNRPQLLRYTLDSIKAQSYREYEVLVIDNGSQPAVSNVISDFKEDRFHYLRYEKNHHTCDVLEENLSGLTGTHFLFIADDDVLLPGALETVAVFFGKNPKAEFLGGGFVHFNHTNNTATPTLNELNTFDGRVEEYDGKENAMHYCNGWGIGAKKSYRAAPMSHSSAIFISTDLLRRTKQNQGTIFIKPFGDIGYVGCSLNAQKVHYLNIALAVIGETLVREMVGSRKGQRHKWDSEVKHLKYTPLKAPSFINMGMDVHLKVLYANGITECDKRLRPDFFKRHLRQIMSDAPWDYGTFRDISEVLPYYIKSQLQFFSLSKLIHKFLSLPSSFIRKIARLENKNKCRKQINIETKRFMDINDFARWVSRFENKENSILRC